MSRSSLPARAFTIIEMVIVLTALGLIVGVTAPRFVNSSARAQARNATRGLVDSLTAQRAETIRSMAPSLLYLVSSASGSGSIRLVEAGSNAEEDATTGDTLARMLTERGVIDEPFRLLGVWDGVALAPKRNHGAGGGAWKIRTMIIEPTGRAVLGGDGSGSETGLALVAPRGGDTIWQIRFDPISGIPGASSGALMNTDRR